MAAAVAPSFTPPATWSPEQTAFVGGFKGALVEPPTDLVIFRAAMAAAPAPPLPDGVSLREVTIPRVPVPGLEDDASGSFRAEWHEPAAPTSDHVLLYAHGGAYVIMSPASHRGITGGIAANGVRVLSIDYRMGPEDPFPAAVVDMVSAFKYLIAQGTPAAKICFAGDSAGGGLTLAAAMYLRDHPEVAPMPGRIAPISPWIDLTGSSPTIWLGDEFDCCILRKGVEGLGAMVSAYAGKGGDSVKKTPYFSPLFDASTKPLPPTLVSLATVDRLYGEDLAFYASRPEPVRVDIYEDQIHVFQLLPMLPQSLACFKRIAEFVKGGGDGSGHTWIAYDGSAKPISDGAAKMKADLGKLLERAEKVDGYSAAVKANVAPYLKAAGKA
ncbi:Alpha/Beta hydrolase protein [Hyaloraphidium curvatum]|nr:Alpha/Beta hydrolase protein [Hyaloraphidium curvatum]